MARGAPRPGPPREGVHRSPPDAAAPREHGPGVVHNLAGGQPRVAGATGKGLSERTAVVPCDQCGDEADAHVATGPDGAFVVMVCTRCAYIRVPYEEPGHEKIISRWLLSMIEREDD